MKRILILGSLLIFTGCMAATGSPTATPMPSRVPPVTFTPVPTITPSPTVTPTQTITPSPTVSPTATKSPPTPDFIDSPIVDGFLISPSLDPDCQLPCWHGLRVGESDRDDVQRMFDETLGFNGMLDFFTEHRLPEGAISAFHLDLPDMQVTGHEWGAPPMAGVFGLYMLVDEDTGILQGIHLFLTSSYDTYPYDMLSPQQVFRELGTPSAMYVRRGYGGPLGRSLTLALIYNNKGIASFIGELDTGEASEYDKPEGYELFWF